MRKKAVLFLIFFIFFSFIIFSLDENLFGRKEKLLFSFKGDIYFLKHGMNKLPDFKSLKPVGSVYTDVLNIKPRSFSQGFPGITDRFEWFAIRYVGNFYVPERRKIKFYLLSDDGSKLIIDGKVIINNDGVHPPRKLSGVVELSKGLHKIEVQYFQGPRFQIALVLSYDKDGKEVPFCLKDFMPFKLKEDKCEVKLTMESGLLFDFNKFNLREDVMRVIENIAEEIKGLKLKKIIVEGHTDSIGSKSYNLKLSKKRAESVKKFLIKSGIRKDLIETVGYGEEKPIASNKTEEGRAKNRRVEIKILKECKKENDDNVIKNVTLKEIGENPSKYKGKLIELKGIAKGWATGKALPENIRKMFLNLPFAENNTGLSRNWGSFSDGTAVILYPVAPWRWAEVKVLAKIVESSDGKWYIEVIKENVIREGGKK